MNNLSGISKNKNIRTNLHVTPEVFVVPLGEYADEIGRPRNKKMYLKLQDLEKKVTMVKEKMEALAIKHADFINNTRHLIEWCQTANLNSRKRGTS